MPGAELPADRPGPRVTVCDLPHRDPAERRPRCRRGVSAGL